MSRVKEITVELKLVAQPKQYQSLTMGVSMTVDASDGEELYFEAAFKDIKEKLSEALTKGIYEEIKKLYGEPAARAALVAYFGQGGQV